MVIFEPYSSGPSNNCFMYKLRKFVRIVRAEIIPCLALTPDLTGSALVDSGFYHAILERIT